MVGGEVMIGRPNDGVSLFGPITSISAYGVQESFFQNSIESSIEQSNGETIMTFTRVINDGIFLAFNSKGLNSFIWAVGGEGVEFPSYHSGGRGLITIDLSKAERPGGVNITDSVETNPYKISWSRNEADVEPIEKNNDGNKDGKVQDTVELDENRKTEVVIQGPIILEDGLTLSYKLVSSRHASDGQVDAVEFTFTYKGEAWLGLGVNPEGPFMAGSEVVIGKPLEIASLTNPGKYSLSGYGAGAVNALPNEYQSLLNASISINNGETILRFTKLLNEANEHQININDDTRFVYAIGSSSHYPSMHIVGKAFTLNLSATSVAKPERKRRDVTRIFLAHAVMAFIAWAVLAPMAAAASYLRKIFPEGPTWFKVHMSFNVTNFVLTIVAFVTAVVYRSPRFNNPHFVTGWIIMAAVILQVALGVFRPHVSESAKPGLNSLIQQLKLGSKRAYWEVAHKLLGYGLLCLSMWQIYTGLGMLRDNFGIKDYLVAYWSWMIAFYACVTCLYIYVVCKKCAEEAQQKDIEQNDQEQS